MSLEKTSLFILSSLGFINIIPNIMTVNTPEKEEIDKGQIPRDKGRWKTGIRDTFLSLPSSSWLTNLDREEGNYHPLFTIIHLSFIFAVWHTIIPGLFVCLHSFWRTIPSWVSMTWYFTYRRERRIPDTGKGWGTVTRNRCVDQAVKQAVKTHPNVDLFPLHSCSFFTVIPYPIIFFMLSPDG